MTRVYHNIFLLKIFPHLDADAVQIDISSRSKFSVPIKNMEVWEKVARRLVAINFHADLFSSAAYQCLQQESMSVNALSRLLEMVAKSIKHATAMSTILARGNAAVASSKIISSPEHEVLMVSYCAQSMSVVRRLSCSVNNCFKSLLLLHPWAN